MATLSIQDRDYVVVDTETTGGSPSKNRIIEVAALHYRDGIILNRFTSLINPGVSIPPWITALTHIDNDMVRNAPSFSDIAEPLYSFFKKGIFVAHNAQFDYQFLKEEYLRLGKSFNFEQLCTLKLARRLYPELKSKSLGSVCNYLLINIEDRHRAQGDAEATVYVLKEMLRVLDFKFKIKNPKLN